MEGPGELSVHSQPCVNVDLGAPAEFKQVIAQDLLIGTNGITVKPR